MTGGLRSEAAAVAAALAAAGTGDGGAGEGAGRAPRRDRAGGARRGKLETR